MPVDRYNLNLAGEYRVASELLKRGLCATVTYDNKKGADKGVDNVLIRNVEKYEKAWSKIIDCRNA